MICIDCTIKVKDKIHCDKCQLKRIIISIFICDNCDVLKLYKTFNKCMIFLIILHYQGWQD